MLVKCRLGQKSRSLLEHGSPADTEPITVKKICWDDFKQPAEGEFVIAVVVVAVAFLVVVVGDDGVVIVAIDVNVEVLSLYCGCCCWG